MIRRRSPRVVNGVGDLLLPTSRNFDGKMNSARVTFHPFVAGLEDRPVGPSIQYLAHNDVDRYILVIAQNVISKSSVAERS